LLDYHCLFAIFLSVTDYGCIFLKGRGPKGFGIKTMLLALALQTLATKLSSVLGLAGLWSRYLRGCLQNGLAIY